jgi:hypothetical protein
MEGTVMSLSDVREFLAWCTVINMGLLLVWFVMFFVAREWVYRLHTRWFKISREQFDVVHYTGMTYFKLAIFLLNLTPWIALSIMGDRG